MEIMRAEAFNVSVAVMDASFFTRLRVTGRDRGDYLNRRLSQKVDDLGYGDGRRATLLDAVGKMQADLEVFAREDDFLIIAPPWRGKTLAEELEKYVFSEDVVFTNVTQETATLFLAGPLAEQVIAALGLPLPDGRCVHLPDSVFGELTVVRSTYAFGHFAVIAGSEKVPDLFDAAMAHAGEVDGALVGLDAYDHHRVVTGLPFWGVDIDDSTIPLEANLSDAIHFDKGCYPGQETIARISNLGHPARKLVRFVASAKQIDEVPEQPELQTPEGKKAGGLTSVTFDPATEELQGLAMVKWPQRLSGTELKFMAGEKCITGRVHGLKGSGNERETEA